ncbi:MAG: ABC transporter permease [Mahellales bacterium]|jgi:ABC-2 type transport system permease protein
MKVLNLALKDFKVTFKDKKALLIMLIMPIVLVLILGFSLEPMFRQNPRMSKFNVGIVSYDQGILAQNLVDIMKDEEIAELINIYDIKEVDIQGLIKDGSITAAIIIPRDFTDKAIKGEDVSIRVYGHPGRQVSAGIVNGIVESYATGVSSVTVTIDNVVEALMGFGMEPDAFRSKTERMQEQLVAAIEQAGQVFNESTQQQPRWITGFEYYSVGMVVMFILFGAMFSVFSIIEERQDRTLDRLFSTGMGSLAFTAGKFIGSYITCLAQAAILIVFTNQVYKVSWGPSPWAVILTTLVVCFAASGFAIFIASVARTKKSADALQMLSIQGMSVLGGSMLPLYAMPDTLRSISRFTINNWGIRSYLSLITGNTLRDVSLHMTILLAIGGVFLVLGSWGISVGSDRR